MNHLPCSRYPLVAAMLLVTAPSTAQDKGKTAAAELTKDAQAALAQLNSTAPLAKSLGPKRTPCSCFPA